MDSNPDNKPEDDGVTATFLSALFLNLITSAGILVGFLLIRRCRGDK